MKIKYILSILVFIFIININIKECYASTDYFNNFEYDSNYENHLNVQYLDTNVELKSGGNVTGHPDFGLVLEYNDDIEFYVFTSSEEHISFLIKGDFKITISGSNVSTGVGEYPNWFRQNNYTDIRQYNDNDYHLFGLLEKKEFNDYQMEIFINEIGIDFKKLKYMTMDDAKVIMNKLNNGEINKKQAHELFETELISGFSFDENGNIKQSHINYIKSEDLPKIKNLEYFWSNCTYVYMERATDRCNYDKEDYLSMDIDGIKEDEKYILEIEVIPDYTCMIQKDYLIGGKSDWKSYYSEKQSSVEKGSFDVPFTFTVPIEERRVIIQSGVYGLYDFYNECLKKITGNDTHVVKNKETLYTETSLWYLEFITFQIRIVKVDGDNRYFSNWYEITPNCINRYHYAEFEETGIIDPSTGKGDGKIDISDDSEFKQEHDRINLSEYNEDLNNEGIMNNLKNGFGLLNEDGLISFFGMTFSYIPVWIWTLIGSGVAASVAIMIFNVIRGR